MWEYAGRGCASAAGDLLGFDGHEASFPRTRGRAVSKMAGSKTRAKICVLEVVSRQSTSEGGKGERE